MWEQRELGCSIQWSKFIEQIVMKNVRRNVKMKRSLLAGNFHWLTCILYWNNMCFLSAVWTFEGFLMSMWGFEVCWKNKKSMETECVRHIDEDKRYREIMKVMLNFCWKTLQYLDAQLDVLQTNLTWFYQDSCTPATGSHNKFLGNLGQQ